MDDQTPRMKRFRETEILENWKFFLFFQVREAARAAHVDEFVSRFPSGYSTVVGERGAQLSGRLFGVGIANAYLPEFCLISEKRSRKSEKVWLF